MNTVEWILVRGAAAVWAVVDWLIAACVAVFGVVDVVLAPVLTPVVTWCNRAATTLADGFYALCDRVPPWIGMTVLSAAVGIGALAIMRAVSNQAAIGRARDDIQASLLALKLFKDSLAVTLKSQLKLAGAIGRLQWHILLPVAVMLPPVMLLAAQMQARYQWRALTVDDTTVLTLTWTGASLSEPRLTCPEGAAVIEAGPVPGGGEVAWRLRAVAPGRHALQVAVGEHTLTKDLVIGAQATRVSPRRPARHWVDQLLYPTESPIPAAAGVAAIDVVYPERPGWFTGATWWMVTFLVLSMVVAVVFKGVFGVRF